MTVVKLPKMDEKEIREALKNNNLCRIAFIEGNFPYISPFQYVYLKNTLYFHFTNYGKKMKILKKNRNVCVSIERFEKDLSSYYFISMQGKLQRIDNESLKSEIIKKMVEDARKNFSTNFLSAHGFDKNKGWDHSPFQNQIFYKLDEVGKPIALRNK
jgi:nitroimidazol reductase NimA-like FMN-containing flavoprotein (pyridoxamine 5'-phosphate oxidase superfamily)